MQYSSTGVAMAAASGAVCGAESAPLLQRAEAADMDLTTPVDVLVVGGGTAGTIAALQAARIGAKTILVERGPQLGGTMTTGGVAFPGLFDAWGKQIIAGIGWELVQECVALDGGTLPDFSRVPAHHWMNQIHINQLTKPRLLASATTPMSSSWGTTARGSPTSGTPKLGSPASGRIRVTLRPAT